jgi:YfiH family protein
MENKYRPTIFNQFPALKAAESRRVGGVSPPPFDSLNLGLSSGDLSDNVDKNRSIFFNELQIPLLQLSLSHQVHGKEVALVENPGILKGYDALISQKKGIYLAVSVADCVPLLVYDPVKEAVAAVHAGWRGTSAKIIQYTLKQMQQSLGTHPADCFAYIGTCIDESSFEVGPEVAELFEESCKDWDNRSGKYLVNLKKANLLQLLEAGVPENQIEISPFSTVLDNHLYFSYRKEKGHTGRMMAVIGMDI